MDIKTVIVTGSDTEIGKTYIGCKIIRYIKDKNMPVRAIKPLESGNGQDAYLLAKAAEQPFPTKALWNYNLPLAPCVAAEIEKKHLPTLDQLISEINKYLINGINVLEGAGGILSPLGWNYTIVDIGKTLNAKFIVVVPNKLGSLNVVSLIDFFMKKQRLQFVILLNTQLSPNDLAQEHNLNTLKRLLPNTKIIDTNEEFQDKIISWLLR